MGAAIGVIANPMSGRDVRRLAARAKREMPEDKRNQIERAVVGAAAAGADRFLLMRDCFRIAEGAVEVLDVGARFDFVEAPIQTKPSDTADAARAMRDAGCAAVIVLGGDGTSRVITQVWSDAPLIPMSTGTNNVFPELVEPTVAGMAAGLVASGAVSLDDVAQPSKLVRLRFEDGAEDFALIDAVTLEGDHIGSLMPFEPGQIRQLVLTRAEPAAVGMSPIGGLMLPCGRRDDFGVEVRCTSHEGGGRGLLAPISPGLFRTAHVQGVRKLALGEVIVLEGPGVVAVDGDRIRELAAGEGVEVCVERSGPRVIEIEAALRCASEAGVFFDRQHWHDGSAHRGGMGCC